jgi:hypothetical protein
MEMYDLNSGGGGGTPLTYSPNIPDNGTGTGLNVPKPGSHTERDTGYEAQRSALEQKNNDTKQQDKPMQMSSMAFSTPISDLDYDVPVNNQMSTDMHTVIPPQASMAPHEMLMAQPMPQPPASPQQAPPVAASTPTPAVADNKYPLGLTKEQYEAVIVAVLVALVFYPDVQAKLAVYIPNFMSRDGSRSMAGLAVSGLIVAVGFYMARRYFVDK